MSGKNHMEEPQDRLSWMAGEQAYNIWEKLKVRLEAAKELGRKGLELVMDKLADKILTESSEDISPDTAMQLTSTPEPEDGFMTVDEVSKVLDATPIGGNAEVDEDSGDIKVRLSGPGLNEGNPVE